MFRVNENIYKLHVALIRVLRQLVSYQTNETCDVFFQKTFFFLFKHRTVIYIYDHLRVKMSHAHIFMLPGP